jgi:glycosyltransferase involved in cell wall biosynthesis
MGTVVSLFGVQPLRVGGTEKFVRELTVQLGAIGWQHVVVFSSKPVDKVAGYLDLPNLTIEVVEGLEWSRSDSIPAVIRILKKYRGEIVHLSFLSLISPLPWIARSYGARKIFVTDHGSRPPGYKPRRATLWKRVAARLILHPVDKVFGVSEFNCRTLQATDLIDRSRSELLYDAIYLPTLEDADRRASAFRSRFQLPQDRELIVQVSWMIPEKGVLDFLEAARMVLQENPRAHFVLVGNGDHMQDYQQRAVQMGISNAVTWTGLLENPVEDGVYAAGDIFCLPSRWQEAFGWVITEAMSFEKPVIASAIGGIPEIIDEGITGYLVPSGSPRHLADRMLKLLNDPETRQKMGRNGRRVVHERFNLPNAIAELIAHYQA